MLISRTGYFWHGRLEWDHYSDAGRYLRENCRPLYVSPWLTTPPPLPC